MLDQPSIPDLADPVLGDIEEAVSRFSPITIESLRNAILLVTGGTGFLGSWVVDILLALNRRHDLGLRMILLTRNKSLLSERRPDWLTTAEIELIEGDVTSFECPTQIFSHVIHAAADTSADAGRRPLQLAESIVAGSRRVLDIAIHSGARRYLFLSSGAVVGRTAIDRLPIMEDVITAPPIDDLTLAYDNAKRYAEHLHLLAASEVGMDMVIARGFAFVGPRMPLDSHFAIGNFIRDALAGKAPQLSSTGEALRSYLYAADAAVWLITILTQGIAGRVYNVGSGEAISIRKLAEQVAEVLGVTPPSPAVPGMPNISNAYFPDISRARNELSLRPWTSLVAAVEKTACWASLDHSQGHRTRRS